LAPANILIPNYNGVGVGELASLEGGAYLARVGDGSATWFNPAGLARAENSSISGSAGVFQFGAVTPEGLDNVGSSFQQLPAAVGFVKKRLIGREKWTGGFQITHGTNWHHVVDIERELATAGATTRATYSSESSYDTWLASLAVGYTAGGKLRLGAALDGQLTESSGNTQTSEQNRTSDTLNASVYESSGASDVVHLRMTVGVQYDPSSAVRLAAVLRTPGLAVYSSGSAFLEAMSQNGSATTTVSLFDPSPKASVRLPLEFKFGAAYVGRRAQIELDLLTYSGAGTYNAFEASETLIVVNDPGPAGPPTSQELTASPVVVDSAAVVNVAVGGLYRLTSSGVWKVHAGFSTDRSPVGPDDTRFTKVNMQTWTVGVSGTTRLVLGSVGVRYESGETSNFTVRRLSSGDALGMRVAFKSLGVVYSFSFRF
jgi:hypothetical protein